MANRSFIGALSESFLSRRNGSSDRASNRASSKPASRATGLRFAVEPLFRLIASFVLSGGTVLTGLSPFSPAMVAAAGPGLGGIASLLGASAGYLLFLPFNDALKYICMCVLILTISAVFRETDIVYSAWFMPVVTAFCGFFVGLVSYSHGGYSPIEFLMIACDGIISGGAAFFYTTALEPSTGRLNFQRGESPTRTISVLILIGTILVSLSGIWVLKTLSLGRAFAMLIVFYASYSGGVGTGCAAGAALGLAMDASSGMPMVFGASYAVCGLVAGLFSRRSRFFFALLFGVVNAAAAVLAISTPAVPAILYEAFVASVLFVITPGRIMNRINVLIPEKGKNSGIRRAREYTQKRVMEASAAFRELSGSVREHEVITQEETAHIFDAAADVACRRCRRAVECWQDDYDTTADTMRAVTPVLKRNGRIAVEDMPAEFSEFCLSPQEYVSAVNNEARNQVFRQRLRVRLQENREIIYRGYDEMSDILGSFASELGDGLSFEPELELKLRRYLQSCGASSDVAVFRDRMQRLHVDISGDTGDISRDGEMLDKLSAAAGVRLCALEGRLHSSRIELLEAEPLSADIGVARAAKNGEQISGDRGSFFKTDEGFLYILLSDGMGTGENAAKSSGEAVKILEKFVKAGVSPDAALRMLNDIMLLRNDAETISATVDLAQINLFSGEVSLLKYGSAPSYVKADHSVRRVKSATFAAGLNSRDDSAPDKSKFSLKPGHLAVIVTDGVLTDGDDGALIKDITSFSNADEPAELARELVEKARQRGSEDDITAIVMKLDLRK